MIIDLTNVSESRQKELTLSAIFLGIAIGVKYTALFFGLINGLFLIIVLLYQKVKWSEIIRLSGVKVD